MLAKKNQASFSPHCMHLCFNRHFSFAFGLAVALVSPWHCAKADPQDIRLALANAQQDIASLKHTVASLRLSVEQLEGDNLKLHTALNASLKDYQSLKAYYTELLAQQKKEYTALLDHRHKQLLEDIQKLILSDSATGDYPKEGISYTIKKGDTLSKIALEHKSKVTHIQAANKIQDPHKDLRVGQTIFIPQGK